MSSDKTPVPPEDDLRLPSRRSGRHTTACSEGSRGLTCVHDAPDWSRTGAAKRNVLVNLEGPADGKLVSLLRQQRHVGRLRRARVYESVDVPVLSLTPRISSVGVMESHMSEKVAFQSGLLFQRHMQDIQRCELQDANRKLFSSIDQLVQVRLAEISVATADLPLPNVRRLAAACDLLDKLTSTTTTHFVALTALRGELYAAVFDDFPLSQVRNEDQRLPRRQQQEERQKLGLGGDYAGLTPYFVEVARLREALSTAHDKINTLKQGLKMNFQRAATAKHVINRMINRKGNIVRDVAFNAWADHLHQTRNREGIIAQLHSKGYRRQLVIKCMSAWLRCTTSSRIVKIQKHLDRETKKAIVTQQIAVGLQRKDSLRNLPKDEIVDMAVSWQDFAEVLSRTVLEDTQELLQQMLLPNVMDARLLLRQTELEHVIEPHDMAYLEAASAQEVLIRWIEMRVNTLTTTNDPFVLFSIDNNSLVREGVLEHIAGGLEPFDPAAIGLTSKEACSISAGFSRHPDAGMSHDSPKSSHSTLQQTRLGISTPGSRLGNSTPGSSCLHSHSHEHSVASHIRDDSRIASMLLAAVRQAHLPELEMASTQLIDPAEDHGRLLYVAHLFLHQPAMRQAKVDALREEVEHTQASFKKMLDTKSLYTDGLHLVCKALVTTRERVRLEHARLVKAFAVFLQLRAKVISECNAEGRLFHHPFV